MVTPGALIGGRYRLVRELGAGGMSVVWEARDELLDREVAVKQLRIQSGLSEQEAQVVAERAMREARINARLQHPHVVAVFDVVEYEGQPSLVMELVPSETLAEALREQGTVAPPEAARLGSQVASALAAAHGLGIVHRDVKPSNILIGEDGRARISDFGISRATGDTTLTMTGMINGTPAYLAPEVARGNESTPAADVFSLGSTLYAALEGTPPFGTEGNAIALLYKVAECDIPTPRGAGDLAPLLNRMLARDPDTRPAMDEVATTLSQLSGDDAGLLAEDGAGVSTVAIPPPTDARPAVGALGAGAAAAVAGAAGPAAGGTGTVPATQPDTQPDPPTAVLPAAEPQGTAPTQLPPTIAPPPAEAPAVRDGGPGHRRRGWVAAAATVAVLLAAVLGTALLWPRTVPPSPGPNATALPAESEQPSDGSAGDETDAREAEGAATSKTTDEPADDSTKDPTKDPTEESTASNEPTDTSEPSETTSEPTATQSGEGDGDGEGDNSGEGGDG